MVRNTSFFDKMSHNDMYEEREKKTNNVKIAKRQLEITNIIEHCNEKKTHKKIQLHYNLELQKWKRQKKNCTEKEKHIQTLN